MPRPKKSPRVRMQIIFEREQAKDLRAFCKKYDREISQVVRLAVGRLISNVQGANELREATHEIL